MDFLSSITDFLSTLPGGGTLWAILMFIIVLGVLVTFHELGHYWAARSVGIRVLRFSVGFGPEIYGWTRKNGERWSICWIPLGGYVQMFGGLDHEGEIEEKDKPFAFEEKTVWQRMWVVFAGPLANFVLAFVFLTGLMLTGEQKTLPEVGQVIGESAAEAAGLQAGDLILSVDETAIGTWDDVLSTVTSATGEPMRFGVERNGERIEIIVTPIMKERTKITGETVRVPFVGISPSGNSFEVQHGIVDAFVLGAQKTYDYTALVLNGLWQIISGAASADSIGGPIMIAEIAGEAGERGLYPFIMLMVIISINLGIINLLPVPVLDGGHLLFYMIEAVRGKPLGERAQEYGYRFGLVLVGLLMIFAIGNDVRRVVGKFTSTDDMAAEQSISVND